MKPRVFLSHSKADRDFIIRLANDLRDARIDVWLDEWEIPPGHSFRHRIFEDGLPSADLFFVYLTPTSARSYWVRTELDAAFIRDVELRGGFLALFVDADATRNLLSHDLQALHSPVLNGEQYERPLRALIARSWESLARRAVRAKESEGEVELLRMRTAVAELDAKLARVEAAGAVDVGTVQQQLRAVKFTAKGKTRTLADVFPALAPIIAAGTTHYGIARGVLEAIDAEDKSWLTLERQTGLGPAGFVGPLVIARLVSVTPAAGDYDDQYHLTDLGITVASRLRQSD